MEIKTDNSKVIEQLQKENAELRARVARFEQAACDLNCHIAKFSTIMWDENGGWITGVDIDYIDLSCDALEAVENETPQQSLAEIQAQAILEAIENTPPVHLNENDYINRLEAYASSLKGKP